MNKKAIFSSLLLAFTSLATASHGQSGGIIGLISNFPFPVDNWRQIAISAATFGLIWFTVYMIVKKLVTRFELEDLFNMGGGGAYGGDDSRNLGIILSLLIVVSAAGASHTYLGFTISSIQQLLLLGVGFMVAALAIAILGGGFGGLLWTTGKTGKLLGEGVEEAGEGAQELAGSFPNVDGQKVKNQVGKAADLLSTAEKEEEEVSSGESSDPEKESDEAAHEIQEAIKLIEASEQSLSEIMSKDLDEFEAAIRDAEHVIGQDQKEEKAVMDIKGRLDDIGTQLNKANQALEPPTKNNLGAQDLGQGRQDFNEIGFKGLAELEEKDLNPIVEDIKFIESTEADKEEEMHEEVQILAQEYSDLKKLDKILKTLKQEIGEGEELDEQLEKMAEEMGSKKIYGEAENEEKEFRKIESYFKNLTNKEKRMQELLNRAENFLENEIKLEEEEIRQLDNLVQEEGPILNQLEALKSNVNENIASDSTPRSLRRIRRMENRVYEIQEHLEKIEKQNKQEEKAAERIFNKLT